jgi:hypothetical protein
MNSIITLLIIMSFDLKHVRFETVQRTVAQFWKSDKHIIDEKNNTVFKRWYFHRLPFYDNIVINKAWAENEFNADELCKRDDQLRWNRRDS